MTKKFGKKPGQSKMTLWVPDNLDIDSIISKHKSAYMQYPLKKEKLLFIVDALLKTRAQNWREKQENPSNYTPLCSELLDGVVHNYKKYLSFLIHAGVFLSDNQFIKGEKCIGYCFTDLYRGQRLTPVEIRSYCLYKSIRNFRERRADIKKQDMKGYSYLTKWWDAGNLRIDERGAFKWIEEYEKKCITALTEEAEVKGEREEGIKNRKKDIKDFCEDFKMLVRAVNEGGHKYGFSGKGHRFYNPISNLKKELRGFLTYDGKPLVSIDIKNSQPYFSIVLHQVAFWERIRGKKRLFEGKGKEKGIEGIEKVEIDNIIMLLKSSETKLYQGLQKSDFQKLPDGGFLGLVESGNLYEYIVLNFSLLFGDRFATREQAKKEVLRILYSDPRKENVKFYKPCKLFEWYFPVTYQLFKVIKSNDYTLLPILLQRIESRLVIDIVCQKIKREDSEIPIFTIHDSIITTSENREAVESIMRSELKRWVKREPTLSVEYLHPPISEWKPIVGFEGCYEISSDGKVRGIERTVSTRKGKRTIKSKVISTRVNNDGYAEVRLSKDGKVKTTFLHILLAKAFIPNPQNKPEVNHKDGNKSNNTLGNLEWVTHAENMRHAFQVGLWEVPDTTKRKLFDECNNRTFDSIKDAAIYYKINPSTLRNRLRKRSKRLKCLRYLN